MKRLLLNRHAEAASPQGVSDFDRPLNYKGLMQANELAGKLQTLNFVPEAWFYSTALRAKTTALTIIKALSIPDSYQDSAIYEASDHILLQIVNSIPNQYHYAALTGHNPGISYLFYSLCNEVRDVPPCTALLIEFAVNEWSHISAATGTLKWYSAPTIQ